MYEVPPVIQSANQPSKVMAVAGKWTEMVCEASGNPGPQQSWKKHDQVISHDDRFQVNNYVIIYL